MVYKHTKPFLSALQIINSFRAHDKPVLWVLFSHFIAEKTGTETLSKLPKVTQPAEEGMEFHPGLSHTTLVSKP